jgi:hypothetical protein
MLGKYKWKTYNTNVKKDFGRTYKSMKKAIMEQVLKYSKTIKLTPSKIEKIKDIEGENKISLHAEMMELDQKKWIVKLDENNNIEENISILDSLIQDHLNLRKDLNILKTDYIKDQEKTIFYSNENERKCLNEILIEDLEKDVRELLDDELIDNFKTLKAKRLNIIQNQLNSIK